MHTQMHSHMRQRSPGRRRMAGVAAVTALALSSAFVAVDSVHEIQQQRRAALDAEGLRRCNALPQPELRLHCLRQLPGGLQFQLATGPLT